MKKLIVLSGNIGVGLTTYGEMLGNKMGYDWLPEDLFVSTFEKIHKSTKRDYCLLSLIENAVKKTIFINEQFLKGKDVLIIEKFLLDELVKFQALMDSYAMEEYMEVYDGLINLLDNICCDIEIEHLLIKKDPVVLKECNKKSQEYFRYMIHDEIIDNLDYFYDHLLLYKDIVIYEIFSDNKNDEEILEELVVYVEGFVKSLNCKNRRLKNEKPNDSENDNVKGE